MSEPKTELPPLDEQYRRLTADLDGSDPLDADVAVRMALTCRERQLSEAQAKIAELEAERSRDVIAVTNCDKLAVARETRTHWQTRAESAEAKLQEIREMVAYYTEADGSLIARIREVIGK